MERALAKCFKRESMRNKTETSWRKKLGNYPSCG
jgi:hypothetical protein